MQLEQFVAQLEGQEQVEYQALVEESQNGGGDKAIRGRLARLAMEVLKRLGEKPNPGPVIGQFTKLYPPAQSAAGSSDLPAAEMKTLEDYPQALVQPMSELQKSKDAASTHKALLDLGEALLVYLTGIQFGEYRKSWPLDEEIEAEFYKNAKRKPSFGVFLGFLRRLVKAEGESILDHLFHKKAQFDAVSEYVLIYDLLSQVINQGQDDNFQAAVEELKQGRTVPKRNLLNFYDSFISMRNSYAHPEDKAKNPERKWPLGEDYYSLINPYVKAGLEELIANLVVLTEYKPFLVNDIDDIHQKSKITLEVGKRGSKDELGLQDSDLAFITTESRYLMQPDNRPFSKLYYNEVPALDPSVAERIIGQEKAKMMEPVLLEMIQQKMTDGVIDEMEYMVLKDTAYTSSISEERLMQLIEKVGQAKGITGEILVKSKPVEVRPILNPWWLIHIGSISENKVEKDSDTDPFMRTSIHRSMWEEVDGYLQAIVSENLDNENMSWTVESNQFQIGALSYTYWGQIFPTEAPLGRTCSIGFAISKKFKWARAERKSRIYQRFNSPSIILWQSFSDKILADVDPTNILLKQSLRDEFEVLNRYRQNLIQLGCCVRDFTPDIDVPEENNLHQASTRIDLFKASNSKVESIEEYLLRHGSDVENGFVRIYSRPYNIEDFMQDRRVDYQKTIELEREMINFMQLVSGGINQLNDYGLSIGFNPEEIARMRDEAKRIEKMIGIEVEERMKADGNFEAVAYIKQRAEELKLNEERVDNLLSKGRWQGYR